MRTVSLPPCPAHRSLPGPQKIWRRPSWPSSPAHVMPRCPRQILAAVVSRCTGGRLRSLISGALVCGLADSSRDRVAGMTKLPTAQATFSRVAFCAWQSRPASVGAGDRFATRSTATSGANLTRLPCRACDARRPSSLAPLSLCAVRSCNKPPDEPSSYRPLCMLDTAGKILEKIICDRLEAFTERPGGLSV
ncbi:unnamed protein product [Trichogramma brassicae]|uniref:Uncharacterized protein n=1 Tax=Trichogramma brassicae TaxID=86971 RepID=A0A6H5I2C6_9HYME|nr:unnamed protein product [Trichogramma brassicae]